MISSSSSIILKLQCLVTLSLKWESCCWSWLHCHCRACCRESSTWSVFPNRRHWLSSRYWHCKCRGWSRYRHCKCRRWSRYWHCKCRRWREGSRSCTNVVVCHRSWCHKRCWREMKRWEGGSSRSYAMPPLLTINCFHDKVWISRIRIPSGGVYTFSSRPFKHSRSSSFVRVWLCVYKPPKHLLQLLHIKWSVSLKLCYVVTKTEEETTH